MTEADIRNKVEELARLQDQADDIHIRIMVDIGNLVDEVKTLRGYKDRDPALMEVAQMLKGANMYRCGVSYVRGCWQFVNKLEDEDRKAIFRYQLSAADIVSLCNMDIVKIRKILNDICIGKLEPVYTRYGMTYNIRVIAGSSRKSFRQKAQESLVPTKDPGMVTAKIWRQGEVDEMALEDLLANLYSRIGHDMIERCRQAAIRRLKGGARS